MTPRSSAAIIALGFAASGCPNYLFEQKFPQKVKEQQVVMPAATPLPADILFVVDNSCSMDNKQANLRANFSAFINEIAGVGDYQIGVVSTDLLSVNTMPPRNPTEFIGVTVSTYATVTPFDLQGIDSAACQPVDIAHGCFRGPDPAKRIIKSGTFTREEQISTFQENVAIGSCGSGTEQGLAATLEALKKTRPGECNEGFLRENANLVIVVLGDEDDTDATPIEQFVNDIAQYKKYSKTRVAMITASEDGMATNCSNAEGAQCGKMVCNNKPADGSHTACTSSAQCAGPSPQLPEGEFCQALPNGTRQCENKALALWDTTFCGWCTYFNAPDCCVAIAINNPRTGEGGRYVSFARAMEQRITQADPNLQVSQCRSPVGTAGACLVDSICQDNYSATLSRIARELVITSKYVLDPPAMYPPGVKVRIKGGRFGAGGVELVYGTDFTVTPDGTTVQIMGEKTPKEGESVEIYFITESS